MDRVVVILGAGASISNFDPPLTTLSLTEAVRDSSRWSDLLDRYHKIAQSANTIDRQAVTDLISRLTDLGAKYNFEDYAEIIDKMASYTYGSNSDEKILHTAIRFLNPKPGFHALHTWTAVPFLLRQLIAERIQEKHECEVAKDYQEQALALGSFMAYLFSIVDLSVVSFNYDDVLNEASRSANVILEDGFKSSYFDAADYINGQSIVAFPHGHARFVLDGNGLRQYPTMHEANQKRLDNLYCATRDGTEYLISGPNSYSFNTFLTSGRDKDNSFNMNPYAAYYQRLASDLLRARVVIVIGFSFRDAHICRLLINFTKVRSDNILFVIDYKQEQIDISVELTKPESLIARLLNAAGVHSVPMSSIFPTRSYVLQDGVDDLNANGVGEIYPQIKMCKFGLAPFLRDYRSIMGQTCNL